MIRNIKIGGITYSISVIKNLQDNDEAVWGYTDYKTAQIYLDEDLSIQKRKQVLIHAALHA